MMMRKFFIAIIGLMILCIGAIIAYTHYGQQTVETPEDLVRGVNEMMGINSPAFENGTTIPVKYTCDGEDKSVPLTWKGAPKGTKSYVLLMYDPDAPRGIFYHWILYNIPLNVTKLPEGIPKKGITPYGIQGTNSFGRIGYGGPCPPRGARHRYVFLLLALDTNLKLGEGVSPGEVIKACQGHILAYAKIVGLYGR